MIAIARHRGDKYIKLPFNPGPIFFKDDIVELINYQCREDNYLTIGFRYRIEKTYLHTELIDSTHEDRETEESWENFCSDPKNSRVQLYVEIGRGISMYPRNFMLYKRPLKNWWKYMIIQLTGRIKG